MVGKIRRMTRRIHPDTKRPLKPMAYRDGWVMVRYSGAIPFCVFEKDWVTWPKYEPSSAPSALPEAKPEVGEGPGARAVNTDHGIDGASVKTSPPISAFGSDSASALSEEG